MTITELAQEAGISRDTLSDLEVGAKKPHPDTVSKVLAALARIEEEVGLDADTLPPGVHRIGSPEEDLVVVEVYTDEGIVRAVVKGTPKNADVIRQTAIDLIAEINASKPSETP